MLEKIPKQIRREKMQPSLLGILAITQAVNELDNLPMSHPPLATSKSVKEPNICIQQVLPQGSKMRNPIIIKYMDKGVIP
ncbi:hypothetical protein V6N11_060338 [Hibiscus sabdariffa]|uniref:Uncharacterized protein n=1 Tax=Hibiscus sabdariffa TaxID=183260 RepID=A0ABR2QQ14_9ROSI